MQYRLIKLGTKSQHVNGFPDITKEMIREGQLMSEPKCGYPVIIGNTITSPIVRIDEMDECMFETHNSFYRLELISLN